MGKVCLTALRPRIKNFPLRPLHYASTFYYAALGVALVAVWLPEGDWLWGVTALLGAAMIGMLLDLRYHRGRLCELCAARVPLDGGELAERYRRLFRTWHWLTDRVWRWPAVLIAWAVITLPLPNGTSNAAVLAGGGTFVWAADQHARLRPWCPYCRWDGGGDEELTPFGPREPSTSR